MLIQIQVVKVTGFQRFKIKTPNKKTYKTFSKKADKKSPAGIHT